MNSIVQWYAALYIIDFCSVCVFICINSVACDEYCLDCLCVVHTLQYISYVYVTSNYLQRTVCIDLSEPF